MKARGQLSLEYLLALLVFLALLGLVAPLITQTYQKGLTSLSLKQAETFADRLDSNLVQLGLLSSGSRLELKVSPPTPWRLEGEGHGYRLTLEATGQAIERETHIRLAEFDLGLEGKGGVRLENRDGKIWLLPLTEIN